MQAEQTARFFFNDGRVVETMILGEPSYTFVRRQSTKDGQYRRHAFCLRDLMPNDQTEIIYDELLPRQAAL
jgi:hypothetical protein